MLANLRQRGRCQFSNARKIPNMGVCHGFVDHHHMRLEDTESFPEHTQDHHTRISLEALTEGYPDVRKFHPVLSFSHSFVENWVKIT